MNVKSFVVIEIEKNDNRFSFMMPVGAPFGEAYDACYEALNHIVEFSKKAAEQAKPIENKETTN